MNRSIISATVLSAFVAFSPISQASHYDRYDDSVAGGLFGFVLRSAPANYYDHHDYRPRRAAISRQGYRRSHRDHCRHHRNNHYDGHRGQDRWEKGHRGRGHRR